MRSSFLNNMPYTTSAYTFNRRTGVYHFNSRMNLLLCKNIFKRIFSPFMKRAISISVIISTKQEPFQQAVFQRGKE